MNNTTVYHCCVIHEIINYIKMFKCHLNKWLLKHFCTVLRQNGKYDLIRPLISHLLIRFVAIRERKEPFLLPVGVKNLQVCHRATCWTCWKFLIPSSRHSNPLKCFKDHMLLILIDCNKREIKVTLKEMALSIRRHTINISSHRYTAAMMTWSLHIYVANADRSFTARTVRKSQLILAS